MQQLLIPKSELLILLSASGVGRTNFYENNYKKTHKLLKIPHEKQTEEILDEIIDSLEKNKKIFIKDSNFFQDSNLRKVFNETVKKNVEGGCVIKYVQLKPKYGKIQLLWAKQFQRAENQNKKENCIFDNFQISKEEGYDDIIEFETNLYLNRNLIYQQHEGLFIEFHSILREDLKLKQYVKEIFEAWIKNCSNPRIILLIDLNKINWIENEDTFRDELLNLNLDFPIYYLYSMKRENEKDEFFNFPNPGMIAYLQYLHSLNLKKSIYITDKYNCSMIKSIGFYYLDISMISNLIEKKVNLVERFKFLFEFQKISSFIDEMEYITSFDDKIKRFSLVDEYVNATDENYFENEDINRIHGILINRRYIEKINDENDFSDHFEDYSALEISKQFQNEKIDYELSQQETEYLNGYVSPEPISVSDLDDDNEPMNKSLINDEEGEGISDSNDEEYQNEEKVVEPEKPKILNSIEDIMDYFGMTYFQRGRDYSNENRISNLTFKMINADSFKLYSKCQGTREKPYSQQGIFKNGRIYKSKCSCPMGDEGICKHFCAMILSYLKLSIEKDASIDNLVPGPFSKIHPLHEWCIKARVLKKNPIKSWENERSSGKVASINLIDSFDNSTEISAVFFNDAVEKYEKMKKGKVYLISRAHITENKYGTKNINIVPSSIVKLYNKRDLNDDLFKEKEQKKNGQIEFQPYIVDSPERDQDETQDNLVTPTEILYKANEEKKDPENLLLEEENEPMIERIESPKLVKSFIDELEEDIETPKIERSFIDDLASDIETPVIPKNFAHEKSSFIDEFQEDFKPSNDDLETPILEKSSFIDELAEETQTPIISSKNIEEFKSSLNYVDNELDNLLNNSLEQSQDKNEIVQPKPHSKSPIGIKEEKNVNRSDKKESDIILIDSDNESDEIVSPIKWNQSSKENIESKSRKIVDKSSLENIFFPSTATIQQSTINQIEEERLIKPKNKVPSADGTPQKVSLKDILKKSGLKVQK
eukprot:gene10336-2750_t